MTHLMKFGKTKNRKLPLGYFWPDSTDKRLQAPSLAVPRVSGPTCRHRVCWQPAPHENVSHASRPGLLVGFLRLPCQMRPDDPDTFTHHNECPKLCNISYLFLETCYDIATKKSITARLDHSNLLTKPSIYFEELDFLDAFVHAHHQHRQDSDNSGNFGDLLHEKKDLLYEGHHSCLRPRVSGNVSCSTLSWRPAPRLPTTQPQFQKSATSQCSFHNTWKKHRLSWVDYFFRWWYSRSWWWNSCWMGVISRSLHGRVGVMFGPVVTTGARRAFSGARTHSNNTAVMTAMIEALMAQ